MFDLLDFPRHLPTFQASQNTTVMKTLDDDLSASLLRPPPAFKPRRAFQNAKVVKNHARYRGVHRDNAKLASPASCYGKLVIDHAGRPMSSFRFLVDPVVRRQHARSGLFKKAMGNLESYRCDNELQALERLGFSRLGGALLHGRVGPARETSTTT